MCLPVLPAVMLGSAILGAGASIYSANKSAKAQQSAQQQASMQASESAKRAEQQTNKLNQKQPGIAAILAQNKLSTSKGPGSTFLTGSQGVTNLTGSLGGRPSLLGS